MLINPQICNRITMESQSLKNAVTEMDCIKLGFQTIYETLVSTNEELIRLWNGNAKNAFVTVNQQTIDFSECFMTQIGDMADNTISFEEKMIETDMLAGEAAGDYK